MYFVATSNPPPPNSFNTDAPRQASPAPLPSPPALFHHFSQQQQQQQQQQQHQQLSMHQMQQPSFIGHAPALYSTQQQPQLQHRVAPQHQPMALPQQQLPPHQLFELVGQSQTGGAPMYILSSPQPQPQQDPRLQPTGLPSGGGAVAPPPSSVSDPAPCEHNNWDNLRAKHSVVTLCCRDCQRKWKQQFPIRNLCPEFHTRLHCTFGTNCPFLHVHRFKSFQKSPDPPGHIVGSVRDRLFAQIALRVLLENPGKEPRDVAGEVHERHRAMLSRGESIVVTSTSDMNSFSSGTNLANFGGQSMVSLTSAPSMTSTDVMRRDPWNGEDSVADLALTATGAPLLVEIPKTPVPLHHHHQQFHMQQHPLSPNTKLVQQQQPMLQSVQQLHPNQPMHFSAAHQHHQQPINMTPSSWQPSTQLPGSSAPRGGEIVYFAQQPNGGPTPTTPSTSHQPQQGMFAPLPPYLPSHTAPFPTFSPFTGVGGEGHHLQGHHHGQLAPPPGMHVAPTASSTVPYVQPAPPHHLHQVPPSLHPMNVPYGGQMVLVMPSTPPHTLQGGSNGDWSSIMNAQRQ